MFRYKKYLVLTTILMLMLGACGGESTQEPAIATAVALTVAAQNTEQANTATPALSPAPFLTQTPVEFSPTLTQLAPIASPTRLSNSAISECAKASLISETIPDGQIFRPGEQFTKTWEIKNVSSCTWDTSYKIVFWNGDVLGGAYVYNLPQITPPETIVPISLVLIAPADDGSYKSEWKFQTPAGDNFGVGEYSAAFYSEIVVSSAAKPGYAVTDVDYSVVREPATGCPAKVVITIYATLTSNGPVEIEYRWLLGAKTDTFLERARTLEFTEAGTKTIGHETVFHLGNTPGSHRWKALIIVDPYYQEFPHINYTYDCGAY